MSHPKLFLKPRRAQALQRRHPWIFSGAIAKKDPEVQQGSIVTVCNHKGEALATGHYQEGSIAVRLFAFEGLEPDAAFWLQKLKNAYRLRQRLAFQTHQCNAYRLIHAEGDGMPGLIIDIYDKTAVIQAHSIGMHYLRETLCQALQQLYSIALSAVYYKSVRSLPDAFVQEEQITDGYLWGEATLPAEIIEHGHRFAVNWETGQKTGFFLDQRDNRRLLANYAKDKRVLNAFCYSGGFSIYALRAGAKQVHSVDASAKAIELAETNAHLNGFEGPQHQSHVGDVQQFLKACEEPYDLMVLDPPAFAKSQRKRHRAVQGYKRLNAAGIRKLAPDGILFTFSCSQVVDRQLFEDTLLAAALEAGRPMRILHRLDQPADHPTQLYHPESSYLKGLVLKVD